MIIIPSFVWKCEHMTIFYILKAVAIFRQLEFWQMHSSIGTIGIIDQIIHSILGDFTILISLHGRNVISAAFYSIGHHLML